MTSNERTDDLPSGTADSPIWQPGRFEGDSTSATDTEPAGSPISVGGSTSTAEAQPISTAEAHGTSVAGPTSMASLEPFTRRRPARAPASRSRSTTLLLMLSALVAVGGVGFALGHNLAGGSSTTAVSDVGFAGGAPNGSFDPGQFGPNASGDPGFRGEGGEAIGTGTVSGTVVSIDADSMTVQLADGQTVTITLGSSTTYHSQASASSSDVTAGSTVIVQTTTDSTAEASASAGTGAEASAGTGAGTSRTATDVTVTSN